MLDKLTRPGKTKRSRHLITGNLPATSIKIYMGLLFLNHLKSIVMRKLSFVGKIARLALCFLPFLFMFLFLLFCSFTVQKLTDDFFKQLGITKTDADERITTSIFGGYISSYGVKNAKNIAVGNRKAVTLDLLNYTKKMVSGTAFIAEYNKMRDRYKPVENKAQTPEELRAETIASRKKAVIDAEAMLSRADVSYKTIFEKNLEDAKKYLKEAEDPNYKMYVNYTKNYEGLVKQLRSGYERSLTDWNAKYPANQLFYVKMRLVEFLEATKDIDYSAELVEKNGRRLFVKPEYERKDGRWKMAFRAGKEVVEPARDFVQKWIEEIR